MRQIPSASSFPPCFKDFGLLFVAALVALAGCSKSQPASEKPSAPKSATISVDSSTAGTISGVVNLKGQPPKMKPLDMTADPGCPTGPQPAEVVVASGGKLANVFVYAGIRRPPPGPRHRRQSPQARACSPRRSRRPATARSAVWRRRSISSCSRSSPRPTAKGAAAASTARRWTGSSRARASSASSTRRRSRWSRDATSSSSASRRARRSATSCAKSTSGSSTAPPPISTRASHWRASWRRTRAILTPRCAIQSFAACFCSASASVLRVRRRRQQKEPLGRSSWTCAASSRGTRASRASRPSYVAPANLPTRSFGLVGGAHVYALRGRKIAFGFGGNVVLRPRQPHLD